MSERRTPHNVRTGVHVGLALLVDVTCDTNRHGLATNNCWDVFVRDRLLELRRAAQRRRQARSVLFERPRSGGRRYQRQAGRLRTQPPVEYMRADFVPAAVVRATVR
jgi:hypothetical protein